jgi:hypothetical protein
MKKCLFQIAVISLAVTLAPGSAGAATDLTQEEAVAYVKGKSRQAKHMDHPGPFGLDFRGSGTLYGTVEGRSDNGSWEVKDAKLCIKWRRWIYDGCGALQRIDGNQIQHLWPDGRVHFVAPAD